jgi:uncharacterized protein
MLYVLGIVLILGLVYGPSLWVRYVLWRYNKPIKAMPGTGGELAQHLIDRFKLTGVSLVEGDKDANYYSPDDKKVSIGSEFYHTKSLSAVAVAAHEVGHAIQFYHEEPVSKLRAKYLKYAFVIKRIGSLALIGLSTVAVVVKLPHLFGLSLLAGVITMLATVFMYVAILPEEYDASFKKALPILEDYVPADDLPKIRRVLKACALTYVAGAIADILSLWRWIRFMR